MKYSTEKITKICAEIKNAIHLLEDIGKFPFERFSSEPHLVSSAKYNFIVAIEGVIDLCNHAISQNSLTPPDDYSHAIMILSEQAAYPLEFAASLVKAIKFRNRLVHIYWEVGERELYAILTSNLDELKAFLGYYGRFMGISGSTV